MTADRGMPGRIHVVVRQIRAARAPARIGEALRDAHRIQAGRTRRGRRPVPGRAAGSGLEFGVQHDAHDEDSEDSENPEDSSLFAAVDETGCFLANNVLIRRRSV